MPSNFPVALDTFTDPTAANSLNTPGVLHHEQHANLNAAVAALQAAVGVTDSTVPGSARKLLADRIAPLSALTGGTTGLVGDITAANFGVNAGAWPINYSGVTTGPANRTGIAGDLAKAVQPGNTVRIFFGFDANGGGGDETGGATGLFAAGGTNFSANRLEDLRFAISACHDAGLELSVTCDAPVSSDAATMALYRDRLAKLLRNLPTGATGAIEAGTFIDSFEPKNELYGKVGGANPAEMMRITATQFRTFSPNTVVLSPSYQGGEAMGGNLVLQMLAGSAAGVPVQGDGGGAGTTGEMFCDAIAFHSYGEVYALSEADSLLTTDSVVERIKQFLDPIRTAIATRRAANPTYWAGRKDPEIWNTELNLCPDGGDVTSNSAFRLQPYRPSRRDYYMGRLCHAVLASGCTRVMPYMVDHQYNRGPAPGMTFAANALGELRVTITSSIQVFDGDQIQFMSSSYSRDDGASFAYNCTADGKTFDARGIPSSFSSQCEYLTVSRYRLGGWAFGFRAVQQKLFGYLETGWQPTGVPADPYKPQLRVHRGQVRRMVAGTLTDIGI